jgi:DNA-binding protein HU-beta
LEQAPWHGNLGQLECDIAAMTNDHGTAVLKSGGEVRLLGFGSFSVAERAAREGRNPATGATIQIAASKQPRFKAGKGLKEAVNG